MSRVVVLGAGGFIGKVLCERLVATGASVIGVVRNPIAHTTSMRVTVIGEITSTTDWSTIFAAGDTIIHLATPAHIPLDRRNNSHWSEDAVAAAYHLAQAAAQAGVVRLIFVSSIKVNGEQTQPDAPFKTSDLPAPRDAYGLTKMRIEEALRTALPATGPSLVIVRPPLVYGPGVKANFRALLRAVQRGVPLPFGALNNRRSMIYVGNLADLLTHIVGHPIASGTIFVARDSEDITVADLLRRLGRDLGHPARLIPVPVPLLRWAGGVLRRGAQIDRLTTTLLVDDSATREQLGWRPPFTVDEALAETSRWFLNARGAQR